MSRCLAITTLEPAPTCGGVIRGQNEVSLEIQTPIKLDLLQKMVYHSENRLSLIELKRIT